MLSLFKKNLPVFLLATIAFIICLLNYTPGTWLSGWDTLHPEFNFPLNLQRLLNGVWRAEQGLGAVAGHSHMADLPRVLFLWFNSLFLPTSFLRYLYFFICLILGPLGVYFFLLKIVFRECLALEKKIFSFLGALFYLLNLGTLQHFFVPFEMFATQYAALGWLFLFATQFLQKPKKQILILFALTTFWATPQAYAATLWYAFFISLIVYLLSWLIINRFKSIKQIFILIGVTLIINSFWLLPNLYYIFQHSGEVLSAKINQLFSEEAFLHNYQYGNLQNVALLKNHLFSWTQLNFDTAKFDLLFKNWLAYFQNPAVFIWGYLFFFLIIFGLMISLFKKEKLLWPFIPVFLFAFIFLINATPPFSYFFTFLRNHFSILKEALRFPFTKFSLILMFTYSLFFAFGLCSLYQIISKFFRKKVIFLVLVLLIPFLLIIFSWPVFQGQLINQRLRLKIPQEYFQAFDWFQKQDNGRILQLPMSGLWGWEYYDWGFQGAGFSWFGLKQPLLTRDFDRWNLKNEKAYQELSYALYAQNLPLFENLLSKYEIKYLLLDQSLIAPEHDEKILFLEETDDFLASSQLIKQEKDFDFLKIYKFDKEQAISQVSPQLIDFTNPPDDLKNQAKEEAITYGQINLDEFELKKPIIYKFDLEKLGLQPALCGAAQENQIFGLKPNENGFILYGKNSLSCVKIPLEKIISQRPIENFLLKISFNNEKGDIDFCLAKWGSNDCLEGKKEDNGFYFSFPSNREIKNYELRFLLNTQHEEKESLVENIKISTFPSQKKLTPLIVDNLQFEKPIEYSSLGEEVRDTFSYSELSHNQSYALLMEAENKSGLPLRFCLTNFTSKRCDLYDNLKDGQNIFFIPPTDKEGQGYDLNLSNYAIGPIPSTNFLKSVKIVPLDYQFIKYQENPEGGLLSNNQSYEKNWRAFEYQGGLKIKSLGKPIMIDNWKNGWILNNESEGQIIFFFLPQLLEYLGFFLLLVFIVLLAVF